MSTCLTFKVLFPFVKGIGIRERDLKDYSLGDATV